MSAGNFVRRKYADNAGNVYGIRLQPETLGLTLNNQANTEPAGAVDQPLRARATGSRRKYGLRARSVRIQFTGAVPEGYAENGIIEVPIMTLAAFNAMISNPNATGTYLESPVELVGSTPESRK